MANYNYHDGIVRDGREVGQGLPLSNLSRDVIRDGCFRGTGSVVGSFRDGLIFEGGAPFRGIVVLNIDVNGVVRDGPVQGMGRRIRTRAGMRLPGEQLGLIDAVAIIHLLVRKIV